MLLLFFCNDHQCYWSCNAQSAALANLLRRFDTVRNFLQNFFMLRTSVPCIIWNENQQKKLGGTDLDLQIFHHVQSSYFHRKCMENGKNGLILTQKREYPGRFFTEFFPPLICVRYLPKDL